jgi:sulfhydrogenase subunit alpha
MKNKSIKVDYLARVEGEGGLHIKIKDNKVIDVKFNIFEPPRFFEAFLQDRHFTEAPDITARICGICPIAYQMSSANAMEMACGIKIEGPLRDLRRLIYCGEWIESHALHVYMLHAPDFLGYDGAVSMAANYPDLVQQGLKLKKIGNNLMILLGGREIHPINLRIGGFYKVPAKKELEKIVEPLKWALEASQNTVRFVSSLKFPDFDQDYEFVSLHHDMEYPIHDGRIITNKGIDIPVADFLNVFEEQHVHHSTSLHTKIKERGAYHVGPLARFNLNFDKLTPIAQKAAIDSGIGPACKNPFKSIIVRAVELVFACEEALRLSLETRSVLGILYFLSESVEAPSKDVQEGKVSITRYDSGELFDWTLITGKLLQIKTQPSKPNQASVAVYYRRSWFYIDDSDLESKSTFSLLSQLIALQSGKTDRVLPVLTLPLGK